MKKNTVSNHDKKSGFLIDIIRLLLPFAQLRESLHWSLKSDREEEEKNWKQNTAQIFKQDSQGNECIKLPKLSGCPICQAAQSVGLPDPLGYRPIGLPTRSATDPSGYRSVELPDASGNRSVGLPNLSGYLIVKLPDPLGYPILQVSRSVGLPNPLG